MTSEKAYDIEQRLNALIAAGLGAPGPWTAFNPFSAGWSATGSTYAGAWVRWMPGNLVFMSFRAVPGTAAENTVFATVPSADSQGNPLRPAQEVMLPAATDLQRLPSSGSNNEGCFVKVGPGGTCYTYGVANAATVVSVNCFYPIDAM